MTKKEIKELIMRMEQDEIVSLWNKMQDEEINGKVIHRMDDFDEIISYETILPSDIVWAVRDRQCRPEDRYFYLRFYADGTNIVSFDDIYMSPSPLNLHELIEKIIDDPYCVDDDDIFTAIMEMKQIATCNNNKNDEEDIPLF